MGQAAVDALFKITDDIKQQEPLIWGPVKMTWEQMEENFYTWNQPIPIKVQPTHPKAKPLEKKRISDIGWDVFCVDDEDWVRVDDIRKALNLYCNFKKPMFDKYVNRCKEKDPDGKKIFILEPRASHTFKTGIKVATPACYGFLLRDRSGYGVDDVTHTAGVIEGTYRGEWGIHLVNLSNDHKVFEVGDKIIQAVLVPILAGEVSIEEELPTSDRGEKGWGSSGK